VEYESYEDNFNKRLRELDRMAFEALKCRSPDDVLEKLRCDACSGAFSSVINVVEEEYNIWDGSRAFQSLSDGSTATMPTPDSNAVGKDHPSSNNDKDNNASVPLVLPLSFRLRPVSPEMHSNGLFRLFFFGDELVAATQASPWTFYVEVFQHREAIEKALRVFGNQGSVVGLVRRYLQRANMAYNEANNPFPGRKLVSSYSGAVTGPPNPRNGKKMYVNYFSC